MEAVGDAVTGGLVARAVEPEAGEGHTTEQACLNCGTALIGSHCHACGQKAHVHRTLTAWWHDFLHGVLHLDGKLWHTLPLLAWKPGDLTRRYIHGERARFVSPLAMFLFSVFLMFAAFSATGAELYKIDPQVAPTVRQELAAEQKKKEEKLARLLAQRRRDSARGVDLTMIDARIAEARQEAEVMRTVAGQSPESGIKIETGGQPSNLEWFNKAYKKAKQNPALLIYKLQSSAYKFSWALIPISVPFVWLLFLHRRRYRQYKGYDHLVFVTYSIAFMSLFSIVVVLLGLAGLGGAWLGLLIMIVPPIHIYRQLRGAYSLSRSSALWRTFILLIFAMIAATLFGLGLLALGVLA